MCISLRLHTVSLHVPGSTCVPGLALVCTVTSTWSVWSQMRNSRGWIVFAADWLQKCIFSVWRDEREGVCVWEREKGLNCKAPHWRSLIQQVNTMEFKGVWVLLGLLLLVNCSFQQTQPRRKPVKKGRRTSGHLQEEQQKFCHRRIFPFFFKQHFVFVVVYSNFETRNLPQLIWIPLCL